MIYDEYLEAGGTREDLVDAIEHFFLDNQTSLVQDRGILCCNNNERNAILHLLADKSNINLGFQISDYSHMETWNCIYYTEPGVIHSGRRYGDFTSMDVSDIYAKILTKTQSHECELPDIMLLFEPTGVECS